MSDPIDGDGGGDGRVTRAADDSFNTSEYRALRSLFRDESHEALEQMTRVLLRSGPSAIAPGDLAELLRTTHSLKGTAGTVGLSSFADVAHRLETVLERVGRGQPAWSASVRDDLVEVVDGLRDLVEVPEGDRAAAAALTVRLDQWMGALTDAATGPGRRGVPDPSDSSRSIPLPRTGESAVLRVAATRIDRLMDSVGELVFDRTRVERRVTELHAALEQLALLRDALGAAAAPHADSSVFELVDELSQQIGQLDRLAAELLDDAAALRRTGNALEDGLINIRMQSSRTLFERLAPQVRALARAAGKRIHLVTLGGETEFDKSVADQIGDSLIHLLRNAVAHGIEPPAARRAAGKPEEGQIILSARHEGQQVVIELVDDGAGIDPAALRRRLVDSGHWSSARARAAGDDEVLRALLDARVSSRETADELAGRGIGLDAVRETVARLGGEIALASTPGTGTTFTMRLPLTTSVSNALLFKVGGQVYAIPNVHVVETAQVEASSPAYPSHLRVKTGPVPLIVLHQVLGADLPRDARSVPAVVIDYASRRLALTCDKIVGPREIVVKNLGPLLSPLPIYAGGTISGSGKVQLILDPAALTRLAYPQEHAVAAGAGRVLVADDSRSVREAMILLLERAGYQVDVASTGLAAWRMLGRARYDALVTDLEMPEMGGFELIERLRADAVLARLPVVIISSRASEEARARARDLGVTEVLGKPVSADGLVAALRPR